MEPLLELALPGMVGDIPGEQCRLQENVHALAGANTVHPTNNIIISHASFFSCGCTL